MIPLFFFAVNVGALQDVATATGVEDFYASQLPVAIVFAVTGVSRPSALVTDIASVCGTCSHGHGRRRSCAQSSHSRTGTAWSAAILDPPALTDPSAVVGPVAGHDAAAETAESAESLVSAVSAVFREPTGAPPTLRPGGRRR